MLLLIAMSAATVATAQDLVITGSWSPTVNAGSLATGAGSDILANLDSVSGQVTIDCTGTGDDDWEIQIWRDSDTGWDETVDLWVRRGTDGSGPGWISGGSSYAEIDEDPARLVLFTASDDRTNVQLQFKLTGLSVATHGPASPFNAVVWYEIKQAGS